MPNLKHMEIVCDVDKLKVDLQKTLSTYKTIKNWAYIIHDKDDTRPHYHIYVHFGGAAVDLELVAKWFEVAPNFVNRIKGRRVDVLKYLTHQNDSQKHKHQYSNSEVVANFDFESEIEADKIIGDFKNYSYAQQLTYIDSLAIDEKVKQFNKLKKLWELECKRATLNPNRNIDVMFIDGASGTGKTTIAKMLANQMKKDVYVSSSSNDPMQDYMGQKTLVLDDIRDDTFEFLDLVKMLDNHTNSSVVSRFNNKVFNGDLIIITSAKPLALWYPKYKTYTNDNITQFYRRFSCYIHVTKEKFFIYEEGVDNTGKPVGTAYVYENFISKRFNNEKKITNYHSVFKEMISLINNDLK